MKILHLMSCQGWSSDAYWAARAVRELADRGHDVTLGCRAGTEAGVISRARAEGVDRIVTFAFGGGVRASDARDVRRLAEWLGRVDVVHVHRGKEHWLAAIANRLSRTPRPIVRTRHIVQVVRAHAANRWLYRRATALVHTVTDAIRRQYIASGLLPDDRVVTLPGIVDVDRYRPQPVDAQLWQYLGGRPGTPLLGMVAGLRVMKGHHVVIEAADRLAAAGLRPRFCFIGRGSLEGILGASIRQARLDEQITLAGFVDDLASAMAALDVCLYVPIESEGMSRVVFEYLAAGRPVIAARVGVVPEILGDREHALLVPAGDADSLAAAVRELLGDPLLRDRLGRAARQLMVDRYSGARVAEALERHYAGLLA